MSVEYPLLSIIVPVYNTEPFLKKCIDSLINETYPNKEIIIVNDCSPDGSQEIIDEYMEQYPNIRCVINEENQGLFHARLRGYEVATGEYICSVDSDDYVGVDYHRQLMLKALETDADIVVSKFIINNVEQNNFMYRTYGNYAIEDIDLKGNDILLNFFNTEFESSHRWLVWNKVYKKSIWDKSYNDFLKLTAHTIMLEDLIYGIVFMAKAQHYVSCNEDTYFYAKHPESSTGLGGSKNKLFKNLKDQINAFNFIKSFLSEYKLNYISETPIKIIQQKQKRVWQNISNKYHLTKLETLELNELLNQLSNDVLPFDFSHNDSFFYRQLTPWNNKFENLKQALLNPEIKFISFDIFDTLIIRPFLKPTDLFHFLNNEWDKLVNNPQLYSFANLRIKAESKARKVVCTDKKRYEDITIDEIYNELSEMTGISTEICNHIKEQEKKLEIKFCTARIKLKEIYDLAVFLEKKVICITDMYLDRKTLSQILENNGYDNIYKLYISGEERLSKATGHLYTRVLKDLCIKPENILHIGDNWQSDIINARSLNLNTFFTPKSVDLFDNKIPDIKNRKLRASFDNSMKKLPTGNMAKYVFEKEYFGIRCMLSIVANKIFDNPFLSYEPETDFNRNPYYIGYYALGMHMYGAVNWLINICKIRGYKKIHFVARDGYLAMQVYKILTKNDPTAPDFNYFYMSRKSLTPLLVTKANDLYYINKFVPYNNKTPRDFINLLLPILEINNDTIENQFWKQGIIIDDIIKTEDDFIRFIDILISIAYSQEKVDNYRLTMKQHFSSIIKEDEVMFDIGYSGRAQALLTSLLGYPINAAYIHYLDDQVYEFSDRFDFQVDCYYDYLPAIIGKIREVVQSEPVGSCIGYDINGNTILPIFEKNMLSYHGLFIIQKLHKGACEFIEDLINTFGDYLPQLYYRDFELNFAHEYFLHYPTNRDMHIFSMIPFEDDVLFGKNNVQPLSDIWWRDLKWNRLKNITNKSNDFFIYNIVNFNIVKKLVYYIMFDRDTLKEKIKNKLENNPLAYKIVRNSYNIARKLYHRFFKINKIKNHNNITKSNTPIVMDQHNDKILLCATSEYGILYSLLLKLTKYRDQEAVLLISEWRKERLNALEKSGIFSKIYVGNELELRRYTVSLNQTLLNANKKTFIKLGNDLIKKFEEKNKLDFSSFSNIIVQANGLFLHYYLHYKNIPYMAYEDGAGIYSNPTLLHNSINKTFPILEQWLIKKYNILNEKNILCKKWYINYDAQINKYDTHNTENLNPIECIKSLPSKDIDNILRIFGVTVPLEYNKNTDAFLILTYPLSARLGITKDEQLELYAILTDIFSNDKIVYIKPHPDDKVDYSFMSNATLVKSTVLSELLEYHIPYNISCAVSVASTALNNLNYISNKIYFDENLLSYKNELLQYYIIYKYIEHYNLNNYTIILVDTFNDLLKYLLKNHKYYIFDNNFNYYNSDMIYIVGSNANDELLKQLNNSIKKSDYIISLKNNLEFTPISIQKNSISGGYISNLDTEYIYIKQPEKKNHIDFNVLCSSLNISMHIKEVKK